MSMMNYKGRVIEPYETNGDIWTIEEQGQAR